MAPLSCRSTAHGKITRGVTMKQITYSTVERHIIAGMIKGLSDNKIGKVVGLKRGEVSFFIKLMMRRLDCGTRRQLIEYVQDKFPENTFDL